MTEYLEKYAQLDVPLWDEIAAAILVDPSLVTRHQTFLMDIDIDHGPGYGNARIYSEHNRPGLDEQPVDFVTNIDTERLTDAFVSAMQGRSR